MVFRVFVLLSAFFVLSETFLFPMGGGGGGGGCCCQPPPMCCCPPPPPCCCPPPPCCCGGGGGGGGGLGGLFGRKKREIVGHTKKFRDSRANDCNSPEINAVINENLKNDPKEDSRRIHTILDQKFPNQTFTVFCSPSPVSYVAQTDVYCVDGNGKQNCYVFQM